MPVVRTQVVIGSGKELDVAVSELAASYRLRTRREHMVTEMLVKHFILVLLEIVPYRIGKVTDQLVGVVKIAFSDS